MSLSNRAASDRRFMWRSRWAAVGAAVAVSVGGGGVLVAHAVAAPTGNSFIAITPCRLLDTRASGGVGGRTTPLGASETMTVQATGASGNCNVPGTAAGVATNVTTLDGTAASFLTIWPGGPLPLASSNNWTGGQSPTPNKVDTLLLADVGSLNIFNFSGTVNVIIDVVGYYEPAGAGNGVGVVPSGTTIVGGAGSDTDSSVLGSDFAFAFGLPTPPPSAPSVAFGASALVAPAYTSPLCTGGFVNPTAPKGLLCIYVEQNKNVKNASITFSNRHPFGLGNISVSWQALAVGDTYLYVSWAYTAP